MAIGDPIVTLSWLATFVLPDEMLRLCDGGRLIWDEDVYAAEHADFGVIGGVELPPEDDGDSAPGATITFLPASAAAAAELSSPDYQGCVVRFHEAEVDQATGEVVGDPELIGSMMIDTTTLRIGKGYRMLDIGLISEADRLFSVNDGNSLSSAFHKSIWSGETGLDNATGVGTTVAWGVEGPPRGTTGNGGFGGGAGIRDFEPRNMNQW